MDHARTSRIAPAPELRKTAEGPLSSPVDRSLALVSETLTSVEKQVARAFESDPDFRDLCEEYESCVAAVRRAEGDGSSRALRFEYAALQLRLERELLRYLQEHPEGQES